MALRLGDIAPDFTQELIEGTIHLHDWIDGIWAVPKAKFLKGRKELRPYLWMNSQLNKNNG